jgi:hypothetical protein
VIQTLSRFQTGLKPANRANRLPSSGAAKPWQAPPPRALASAVSRPTGSSAATTPRCSRRAAPLALATADLGAGVAAVTTASRRRPPPPRGTGSQPWQAPPPRALARAASRPARSSAGLTTVPRRGRSVALPAPCHHQARRRRGCGNDVKPASRVRCRGLGRWFLHAVSPWRLLVRLRDA